MCANAEGETLGACSTCSACALHLHALTSPPFESCTRKDDFFKGTPDFCIPEILKAPNTIRKPHFLPSPTPRGPVQLPPCWQQCPPTYHAFAWIYRAPLMRKLVDGLSRRQPPLEPLDIWVWELMAEQRVLNKALCVEKPLVDWRPRQLQSIKDQQDDSSFLARIYRERGYGQHQ